VWNISHYKKKWVRCGKKKSIALHVKYPLFLSDFNETRIFSTDFLKIPQNEISWKSLQREQNSMRTDGRTKDMMKLIDAFRKYVHAPNLAIIPPTALNNRPWQNWRIVSYVAGTPFCGSSSIPDQIFCDLSWKKSHRYLFLSEYFAFTPSVWLHQCFTLAFICTTSIKGRTIEWNMGKFQ